MLLMRVENPKNPDRGIMGGHDRVMQHHPSGSGWANYPPPWRDKGLLRNIKSEEVCACASYSQFRVWWPDELLHNLDLPELCVVVLNVPDMYVENGDLQSLVVRRECTVVRSLSIQEFVQMPEQMRVQLVHPEFN